MRRLRVAYAASLLLGAVAVAATAQDRPERPRSFVLSVGPEEFQIDMRRGRMGITLDLTADAGRDTVGVRVAGVTPGGPADRAGVQTGDLITRFNGTRLAAAESGAGDRDWDDQSRPALRLLRMASRMEPGDTVLLDVRRGSRNMSFTFVAEETDMDRIVERLRVPLLRGLAGVMVPGGPQDGRLRVFASGAGVSDLELVRVNPGLSEYFGTSTGLLVVDVGSDTALGLRAGDVILSIGSRRPTSPAHAMRILGTYEGGENIQFEIMRQKRRTTVQGSLPQAPRRWRVEPNSFQMRLRDRELRPLIESMPGLDLESPPLELERFEPLLRMRLPSPRVTIEEPRLLLEVDGWT